MNALQIFSYNETPVTFKNENGVVFLSATEMAKQFGKRPIDYLKLPTTVSLLDAIVRKSHISNTQLVITKQGSSENGGGTWMQEDIALDFAQWLSIDFKLWCNDRIKELLHTGVTTISNDDEVIAQAMQVLQNRLEVSRQEKEQLALAVAEQKPFVKAFERVIYAATTYTLDTVSDILNIGRTTLSNHLKSAEWAMQDSTKGTSSTRYAELQGYAKTVFETVTVKGVERPVKKIVITKKGLIS